MLLTILLTIAWFLAETFTDLLRFHFNFNCDLRIPFPAYFTLYWRLQVWYFFAQDVPFIAAEQIFVCAMLCAKVLAKNLKQLIREIKHVLTIVETPEQNLFLDDLEENIRK